MANEQEFPSQGPTAVSTGGYTTIATIYPVTDSEFVDVVIFITGTGALLHLKVLRQGTSDSSITTPWLTDADFALDGTTGKVANQDKLYAATTNVATLDDSAFPRGEFVMKRLGGYAYVVQAQAASGPINATVSGKA